MIGMATYKITSFDNDSTEIEADEFKEKGSFVVFENYEGEQVYATPSRTVASIQRVTAA